MKPCARIARQLPWFAGGDLDAAAAADVRAHLLACARCRAQAATLHQAVRRLGGVAGMPAPGTDEAMFAAMHQHILARVADAVPAPERKLWPVAAAAACLLLAVGWWTVGSGRTAAAVQPRLATPATFEPVPGRSWSGHDDRQSAPDGNPALGGRDAVESSGILSRDRLRQFVDEGMVLPPRQPTQR